ncbi:MAG: amylo-alpha-1,6-glucosidase [Verrucomicrobiales bacterium]|nr:amylo-alpha-1,6-glucosidase [Verrucomicrobiales bacterium]
MDQSKPVLSPAAGERLLRFVGDKIHFSIRAGKKIAAHKNWSARLRTNLGRAAARRREIISAHAGQAVVANSSWRDVPMQKTADGWEIELPLAEAGYFKAKAYLLDENKWQHWPDGSDVGISVHPNFTRTANTIYCAFTRLFGAANNLASSADEKLEARLKSLEALGYATLPPSGKFRDLTRQLPHIVHKLGCRIIHLLPVHPTPTTYARFGRFGSPYAALDLTAVDPALVEFDKRTTGIDQFCELTYAAHSLGARVFIDIVINHTGWGSTLQENHPEFFLKNSGGEFASPGAWGTVWEDLVELEQHDVALWDIIAGSLIIWCKRGVDGFRCDAGYKIPAPAWQYIVARVQEEFPEIIFLLEGLGGSWDATELLLTEGGMQWAYSEMFQNYSGKEVAWYLDYASRQNERVGSYVHYSETHDNSRLAEKGRAWSLLRNRLCALASPSGGFGFTCGVEWLATEKIRVHGNTGLNWDAAENIVPELAKLNRLISGHPCFFDGAKLTRLSAPDSPVYALLRESAEGKDSVLILVNTDVEKENIIALPKSAIRNPQPAFELLGQPLPKISATKDETTFTLAPGAAICLAPAGKPVGLNGDDYRRARAQAAWAIESLNKIAPVETIDGLDWRWLAEQAGRSPKNFLAAAGEFAARAAKTPLADLLREAGSGKIFPRVVGWTLLDARRVTPVPHGHWLLIEDSAPFRATLELRNEECGMNNLPVHVQSIPAGDGFIACFAPDQNAGEAGLILERYAATAQKISAAIRFLAPEPQPSTFSPQPSTLALLTNGIGGMARLCADLGRVNSKYDCVLGANLNPTVPVDRHVFVKRIRVWVNADGFLSPLDFKNLVSFQPGPPVVWNFVANAGDGRTVEIELRAGMIEGKNTTVFQFSRPAEKIAHGKQLPADADVRLTVRVDIEDRNFHSETKRNGGADFHFSSNTREIKNSKLKIKNCAGFEFTPASDRQLRVFADAGEYHPQPEWCENIPHPVEQTRGQAGSGDAYSPGWFEIPLAKGTSTTLVLTAEKDEAAERRAPSRIEQEKSSKHAVPEAGVPFSAQLERAAKQFVVRRDEGRTVIAGYPWFLDWGRDSLICARGLLAAGMVDEVKQLLLTFAKFEKDGTLPNIIHGSDVSNRDTSDAPLWFAVVCEEFAAVEGKFYSTPVDSTGRTIHQVLESIAENYARGTPNGIRMDTDSALIWSPSHFTWMDTNFPAGTPREGYPVEIQVLWIRLLRLLEKISDKPGQKKWRDLAGHATVSFEKLFWLEDKGWFADVLIGGPRIIARDATASDALRSNCLFAVSLGLVTGERAKRCVEAAQKYLVVPGALRSLAPLTVSVPLPIDRDGHLLNHPVEPYWPRYEGDEDTRRKPAYHNGTAWTWTFPTFCEALAAAWNFSPEAVAAAKSYLGSSEKILNEGCLGQLPEILDGDAPHTQRGCDAQAWDATEALRVWKMLSPS